VTFVTALLCVVAGIAFIVGGQLGLGELWIVVALLWLRTER
jgi:hypothetical protein